jgi:hypothetical protein
MGPFLSRCAGEGKWAALHDTGSVSPLSRLRERVGVRAKREPRRRGYAAAVLAFGKRRTSAL